jgi:mRNA-degrading endonuclease RelE of RelBE toxin-antitoxin system
MYTISYSAKAVRSYIKLSPELRKQVDEKLGRIARNPYEKNNNISPIKGRKYCYRLRIGDWRIVYELIQKKIQILDIVKRFINHENTSTNYYKK